MNNTSFSIMDHGILISNKIRKREKINEPDADSLQTSSDEHLKRNFMKLREIIRLDHSL